jgi:pseudaminic acid biosynthesis-associated methylase
VNEGNPVKARTEQEEFWAGEFGDKYIERNRGDAIVAANIALFSRILSRTGPVRSAIEFGANIGLNLRALRQLLPEARLSAVEINKNAVRVLRTIPSLTVYHQSILEFTPRQSHDLALAKTVLIHIDPINLTKVYDLLYKSGRRFICLAEYYNPKPVEVAYRGHRNRLFKRDFAGEMLDRHPDLTLVDYGFVYHRDAFMQDDLNWFLLGRR